jgi:hypothetical protein
LGEKGSVDEKSEQMQVPKTHVSRGKEPLRVCGSCLYCEIRPSDLLVMQRMANNLVLAGFRYYTRGASRHGFDEHPHSSLTVLYVIKGFRLYKSIPDSRVSTVGQPSGVCRVSHTTVQALEIDDPEPYWSGRKGSFREASFVSI